MKVMAATIPGTAFYDSATAANGMFINKAGFNGGRTIFYNSSSAANGTFLCESGTAPELAGNVTFIDRSTAGDATITLESSVVSYSTPYVSFSVESSAGNATVIANGGATGGALGGEIDFSGTSTAGNATLIVNGGTNGGKGGKIYFSDESDGGTAQVRLSGNAGIHMPNHDPGTVTLGSLAGDGLILLETISLTVGTNNLTTEFDGSIRDSGQSPGASFTKTGSGTFTLTRRQCLRRRHLRAGPRHPIRQ